MATSEHEEQGVIPLESSPPTRAQDVLIRDAKLTRGTFLRDPFSAYDPRAITAPSMTVLGVIGSGRSLAPSAATVKAKRTGAEHGLEADMSEGQAR